MDHRPFRRTKQDFSGHGRGSGARLSRFDRLGQACSCMPALLMLVAIAWLGATGCGASEGSPATAATPTATPSPSSAFTICSGQTYALCAVANCFVLDGLAYCKCEVKSGDSISLSDALGVSQNICSVNAEGAENGYMASTFSLPDSVVAPNGNQALYSCPASTSNGAYAQCDGGCASPPPRRNPSQVSKPPVP